MAGIGESCRLPVAGGKWIGVAPLVLPYTKFLLDSLRFRDGQARYAGITGAAFGPATQSADLFVHRLRQWHGFAQRGENVRGREFVAGIKSVVERTDDGLLDFCATEFCA